MHASFLTYLLCDLRQKAWVLCAAVSCSIATEGYLKECFEEWSLYRAWYTMWHRVFNFDVINEGFVCMSTNCHQHFLCVLSTVSANLCHWQDLSRSVLCCRLQSREWRRRVPLACPWCWGFLNQYLLLCIALTLLT